MDRTYKSLPAVWVICTHARTHTHTHAHAYAHTWYICIYYIYIYMSAYNPCRHWLCDLVCILSYACIIHILCTRIIYVYAFSIHIHIHIYVCPLHAQTQYMHWPIHIFPGHTFAFWHNIFFPPFFSFCLDMLMKFGALDESIVRNYTRQMLLGVKVSFVSPHWFLGLLFWVQGLDVFYSLVSCSVYIQIGYKQAYTFCIYTMRYTQTCSVYIQSDTHKRMRDCMRSVLLVDL